MRQYQVPQFIMVEDQVIGPFTIKQALYLGGGALLILGVRTLFQSFLFYPLAGLIGGLAASLAFLKINEQPFWLVLKNAVFYVIRPRLYTWQKRVPGKPKAAPEKKPDEVLVKTMPKVEESKLSDLAWSLDIKERLRQ